MAEELTVLGVSILVQDNDGEVYEIETDQVENMKIVNVMGSMLHTHKTQVQFNLAEGAKFQHAIEIGEDDDESEDDDEE